MRVPSRRRIAIYTVAAIVAAALSFIPTSYALIMPGSAVDLRTIVTVVGHARPREQFFLTDVTLQPRATAVMLLAAVFPGTRVLQTDAVLSRDETPPEFDTRMKAAMDESQAIAAFIAERAAHLPLRMPKAYVAVYRIMPGSRANGILQPGDVIRFVGRHIVRSTFDVTNTLFKLKPGAVVRVSYSRGRRVLEANVRTIEIKGKARLGILLAARFEAPKLPVAVRYRPFNVSGSSGGLMFALAIFRSLHEGPPLRYRRIAGTGTISYDGTVGPIEGATQKLIAAQRAGAQLFFVPKENFAEIARRADIEIISVHTFDDALRALTRPASNGHAQAERLVSP